MTKVLFSFILMMTVGILCAQEVTLEVNLIDGSSVEISGTATLNIQTPEQWAGMETVYSNIINGTAFSSEGGDLYVEMSLGLGPQLDDGIILNINGNEALLIDLIGIPVPFMPISTGSTPIEVLFQTFVDMDFNGVPPGQYLTTFMFSIVDY